MAAPDTLVFGASGFIGRRLLDHLGPRRSVGTYAHAPIPGGLRFDGATTRLSGVLPAGSAVRRAIIMHGITGLDACAREPEVARAVNVAAMQRLILDLLDRGIRPVFTSTDAVFDGERGGYTEEDEPRPIIEYGRQKRDVERFVLDQGLPVLILRFSKVVAFTRGTHSLFGEWLADAEAGRPIRCATDQIFSPVCVEDVVSLVAALAESDATGIVHVAGPEPFSRFGLYELFRAELGRTGTTLPPAEPCSIRDFPFAEARPRDTSLRIERLRSLIAPRLTSIGSAIRSAVRSAGAP